MYDNWLTSLFNFDRLAMVMTFLVVFIGLCVGSFSYRYMRGDIKYRTFFLQFTLLIISAVAMVSADHLVMLFITWCSSNILLVRLMIHKSAWKAAKASGSLAAKHHLFGAACIAIAFWMLYAEINEPSIQIILSHHRESTLILPALILILIGAMTQSSIWPFHRWLTSSLNSPTPVSAIMHAGLVNGGGFLLARFAPLYLQRSTLLTVIFCIGMTTALLGTFWKLIQSDVKRMLACSTMGQMGFMFAQCGLGLFTSAIAHLFWHGMFKAYLFLNSGSAAQEKRFDMDYPPKILSFSCALLCGMGGAIGFSYASNKALENNTTLVLMFIAFIGASQFALAMLRVKPLKMLPLTYLATAAVGIAYGTSIHIINKAMGPMSLMQPKPLNIFHFFGVSAMALTWLSLLFFKKNMEHAPWMLEGYVIALNASQPHPETITTHHNQYQHEECNEP